MGPAYRGYRRVVGAGYEAMCNTLSGTRSQKSASRWLVSAPPSSSLLRFASSSAAVATAKNPNRNATRSGQQAAKAAARGTVQASLTAVHEQNGQGTGADRTAIGAYEWATTTHFDQVTYDTTKQLISGSVRVEGTYTIMGQVYSGSADITFP